MRGDTHINRQRRNHRRTWNLSKLCQPTIDGKGNDLHPSLCDYVPNSQIPKYYAFIPMTLDLLSAPSPALTTNLTTKYSDNSVVTMVVSMVVILCKCRGSLSFQWAFLLLISIFHYYGLRNFLTI